MSLLKSCNKDGLPNPRFSFLSSGTFEISQANQEVQQTLTNQNTKPKKKWVLTKGIYGTA